MSGDTHKLLVELGEKWMKRQGFPVVASSQRSERAKKPM